MQEAVIAFSVDYGPLGLYSFSIPTGFISFTMLLFLVGLIFHWRYKYKTRAIDYTELQRILSKMDEDERTKTAPSEEKKRGFFESIRSKN
jgi:hypothetical protein